VRGGADTVTLDWRQSSPALTPGQAAWSPLLGPRSLGNFDETTIRAISAEVKRIAL
jgi:hypothetical protein